MTDFDHILNWELKAGSHQFPGPAGGTCINEAAIVAAGFEYKSVRSWRDCPPCFSPVLSSLAILVNDSLDDRDRAVLMPLVTRLAGSAGDQWVEAARVRFIIDGLRDEFLDQFLSYVDARYFDTGRFGSSPVADYKLAMADYQLAKSMLSPVPRDQLGSLLVRARNKASKDPVEAVMMLRHVLMTSDKLLQEIGLFRWHVAADPFANLSSKGSSVELLGVPQRIDRRSIWISAAKILTRAFEIGPRAPELDTAKVVQRMAAAKEEGARLAAFV